MPQSAAELWDAFEDEDYLGDVAPAPFGAGRPPVTFAPSTPLGISVYLALGADLTADPSTWSWTLIPNELVRYQSGITATTGRQDESSQVGPGSGSLVLDNRDGRFSRRNPLGPYYGLLTRNTPILVEVNAGNGGYPFLRQYVNEWPVRMNKALTDFTVPIRTGGIMRRLAQGASLDESAMRRAILGDPDLLQYWPCEDGTTAQTLASALGVGSPMYAIGNVAAGASTADGDGTDPLPVLAAGTTWITGGTPAHTTREWTFSATYYFTSVPVYTAGTANPYLLYVPTGNTGTLRRWALYWNDADNTVYLTALLATGAAAFTTAGPVLTNAEMVDCWLTFWVSAKQNGANVNYAFGVERTTTTGVSSSAASGTANTQTVYQVDGVQAWNGKSAASVVVGHVFVMNRALTSAENTPAYGAVNAFTGETASDRITRLCGEMGVPITTLSSQGETAAMGPQIRGSLLALLRDCETVDGGVLYEDGFGLGYQSLNARYNLVPSLRLDVDDLHLAQEPTPTDDDQQLRNSWTITRTGGTSATYTDDESVAVEGLYADSKTLNVETDDQCAPAASWLVHMGTNPDHRWPSLSLRFDTPQGRDLIQAWIDMGFGQRITVAHPPYQVSTAGDPIDVIVEGRSERVDHKKWAAELNSSPARPYDVLTLDDPVLGRLDTDGSTLTVAIDTDDTSLTVATTNTDSPLWTTAAAEFPFDVEIGGERLTVTAISGASSPQTFTVTRSVNGVAKSHAVGAAVSVWHPAVLAR